MAASIFKTEDRVIILPSHLVPDKRGETGYLEQILGDQQGDVLWQMRLDRTDYWGTFERYQVFESDLGRYTGNGKKCECGKDQHGFMGHSLWCPAFVSFE